MKRISKKEFKDLLLDVACALITCDEHNLIADQIWVSKVWKDIARVSLLNYPQNDIDVWLMRYNYLHDLCKTIKR